MAKRGATSELNHSNWDKEEPPEVQGTFQKATSDVMQRRIVKVAKRRSAGPSDQGASKNIFSSFQGFKTPDSAGKPNSDLNSTFSFLKNSSSSVTTNGVNNQTQSSLNTFVSSSTNNTNQFSVATTSLTQTSNMTSSNDNDKYPAKLVRLNQCVSEWIKTHVDKDPCCILTPIFRDYERYLKEIEDEKNRNNSEKGSDSKDSSTSIMATGSNLISSSNTPSSNFKLNQLTNKSGSISSNTDNLIKLPTSTSLPSSPFLASSITSSTTPSSDSLFSTFKMDSTNKSGGVSLLSKPDPASLMINPFTSTLKKSQDVSKDEKENSSEKSSEVVFKQPQDTPTGFSFTSGKILPFGSSSSSSLLNENSGKDTNNDCEGENEESDEPPKAEFTPVHEKDSIFNKRCKVFIKKETNYADLGVGTLFIKPVTGEKHQLIVRADTSLGNVLVNVLLTSAIPMQRMGKNNVMVICVPTPPPAGTSKPPTPSTVLLRVKTSEEADELLNVLEKYKK